MRTHRLTIGLLLALATAVGCSKSGEGEATSDARAGTEGLECNHNLKSTAWVEHAWPFPAEYRDLRMTARSETIKLKLKPNSASPYAATITWREGDIIPVSDSSVRIVKPRRLVAKRDIFVTRKVIVQGVEQTKRYLAAAKGEVGSFLFYNSQGMCLVGTQDGPAWTACTLDDTFEGLSVETPDPCEQVWWVQTQRGRVDKGWMPFDPAIMARVPPPADAAK